MPEIPRPSDPFGQEWILLVLLVAVGTLGWINLVSPKKWRLLARALFAMRLGRQTLRDELDLQDRTLIGLVLMASAVLALFTYQFSVAFAQRPTGIWLWVELLGIWIGALVLQVVLVRSVRGLVQVDGGLTEYLYTLLLLHAALGVALLPVTGVITYPHRMGWRTAGLWTGAALVAVVSGYRWVRGAVVGMSEGVPLRYILIYLCTLEILPVALVGQLVLKHLHGSSTPL